MLHIGATTFMSILKKYEFELCDFEVVKHKSISRFGDVSTFGGYLLYKAKKHRIYAIFNVGDENGLTFFYLIDVREQRKCKEWNPYID
jgi:hypothetical protein